jgi:hypothetical protein
VNLIKHRIEILARTGEWTQAQFANAAGMDPASFSKWKNGISRWNAIDRDEFDRLVTFLEDNQLLKANVFFNDHDENDQTTLFHLLAHFYKVKEEDVQRIVERAIGVYRIYRPSMNFPGRYYIGRLEITYDRKTFTLKTDEFYQYKSLIDEGNSWHMTGYCIPKDRYFVILSTPLGQDVQIKYVSQDFLYASGGPAGDKAKSKSGKIRSMFGCVVDMQDNRIYSAPLYFERSDTPYFEMDAVPLDKLPEEPRNLFLIYPEIKDSRFALF